MNGRTASRSSLTHRLEVEIELLARHVDMLQILRKNQPVGIIRLASLLHIPVHKVRYSLRILEREGYLRPSPVGAILTKKAENFLPHMKRLLGRMVHDIGEIRDNL